MRPSTSFATLARRCPELRREARLEIGNFAGQRRKLFDAPGIRVVGAGIGKRLELIFDFAETFDELRRACVRRSGGKGCLGFGDETALAVAQCRDRLRRLFEVCEAAFDRAEVRGRYVARLVFLERRQALSDCRRVSGKPLLNAQFRQRPLGRSERHDAADDAGCQVTDEAAALSADNTCVRLFRCGARRGCARGRRRSTFCLLRLVWRRLHFRIS